jgi:hypothetical protein
MGVFPSYYEPWGYTPLECLALGLPTVTTDLSGFGAYVERHVPDALQNGVLVLNRSKSGVDACINNLSNFLFKFCELNRRERISLRNRAERITERFTWDVMAAHYHRAHAEALRCLLPPEIKVPPVLAAAVANGTTNSDTVPPQTSNGATAHPRNGNGATGAAPAKPVVVANPKTKSAPSLKSSR